MLGAEEAPTFYQTDSSLLGTWQLQALSECPLVASHRERLPAQSPPSVFLDWLPRLEPVLRKRAASVTFSLAQFEGGDPVYEEESCMP